MKFQLRNKQWREGKGGGEEGEARDDNEGNRAALGAASEVTLQFIYLHPVYCQRAERVKVI